MVGVDGGFVAKNEPRARLPKRYRYTEPPRKTNRIFATSDPLKESGLSASEM